jgi:hypothetical protein
MPIVAALALGAVAAVAGLAAARPNGGAASVAAAIVLAPVAVWCVLSVGERIAGTRFGVAAAIVYVVLPFVGRLYFYGSFVQVYNREIAPALVGLRSTGWFALGVAIAVAVATLRPTVLAASGAAAFVLALVLWPNVDWTRLYGNFHETTWSPTLLSLLPFACVIAVGLREPRLAAALGGWIGFFILRGAHRPYAGGGFWLSLAAATPAAALLLSSLGLLVPRLRPVGAGSAAPPGEAH